MAKLKEYLVHCNNVAINTKDEYDHPFSSYASFYYDGEVVYVSIPRIALHVGNIEHNPTALALFTEVADVSKRVQDRHKVTLECNVKKVEKEDPIFKEIMPKFEQGSLSILVGTADLNLYVLTPTSGELTFGFGETYVLSGEKMNEVNLWSN